MEKGVSVSILDINLDTSGQTGTLMLGRIASSTSLKDKALQRNRRLALRRRRKRESSRVVSPLQRTSPQTLSN